MIAVPDIAIDQFWPLLFDGDHATLSDFFSNDPLIDDPRVGRVEGMEQFAAYVAATSKWLARNHARVEAGPTIVTPLHAAAEVLLYLQIAPAPIALPVLIVADRTVIGGLAYLRIYHSLWPLHHQHVVRPPLLPQWTARQLPPVVSAYLQALAAEDVAAVLRQFNPTAYVREPIGVTYTYRSPDELRCFYSALLANGGIELEPCMLIDDGERCVLEYNVTRWGRKQLQSQPGAAVFERSRSNLIRAVRLYDDIELPAGSDAIVTSQGS